MITPNIVAGAKGTSLLVVEEGGDSYVCVLSGSVAVAGLRDAPDRGVRLERCGVADYAGGRLESTATPAGPDAWAEWVVEEARRFACQEMVRGRRLPPRGG